MFWKAKPIWLLRQGYNGSGGVLDRVTITKTSKGNLGEPRRVSAISFIYKPINGKRQS